MTLLRSQRNAFGDMQSKGVPALSERLLKDDTTRRRTLARLAL